MKGRKLSFPAADGHHGIGIQRTFHAAVQHGAARFAGGGKVGARHAAAQRHHAGTNDLQRAVHAQLNGFAAVGQQAAVLVDGAQADSGAVPGGAVGEDGVVHGAFQPDALHRFPHHGAHGVPSAPMYL